MDIKLFGWLKKSLSPKMYIWCVRTVLLYTISTIHTQMTSLLRHWDDRAFLDTILLLGLEEGSFYEPPAPIVHSLLIR